MELFELILILLACVIFSSVLDQVIPKMSLPLLQIAVGLILAILIPRMAEVHVDSELFMTLFIAPLLFREAKEADRRALWNNKWTVLSMAIALVIVSVLAAGYMLHWIVPSIPLAAAFGCAAALGPTDAAAVSALGSTINLSKRQQTLLSGEALINDASGVVSFQFAIAAAVTGAFSMMQALGTFLVLFFGGIAFGAVLGLLMSAGMSFLRKRGYVGTIVHVLYEVLSPFVIFLFAEAIGVSGILAVVAAGLMMRQRRVHLISPEMAEQQIVSNSFWEVMVFLINGVLFVMLGMQLPKLMRSEDMEGLHPAIVIVAILAVTATIILIRLLWLAAMERAHRKREKMEADENMGLWRTALVTTIAGPKGAVTLSIILTIPLTMDNGLPFPHRSLIIFLTSGVILCTLLLADILLPRLAPKEEPEGREEHLKQARVMVLKGVVNTLHDMLEDDPDSEFAPAGRWVQVRYRVRLMRYRFELENDSQVLTRLIREVLKVQQQKADEIQQSDKNCSISDEERVPYYDVLRSIRASIGYFDGAEKVGSRMRTKKGNVALKLFRFKRKKYDSEKMEKVYYETCLFAIELEKAAMDYLKQVRKEAKKADDPERERAARILLGEHNAALQSLKDRVSAYEDKKSENGDGSEHSFNAAERFRKVRRYTDEAEANALNLELEQIRKLRMNGTISESEARQLREEVYLKQTAFLE